MADPQGQRRSSQTVGQARLAVALTIKSVWDFPEMLQRSIVAMEQERTCARRELQMIGRVCAAILEAKRPPSNRANGRR